MLLNKIDAQFGSDLTGRTFAIWGLAFKPNTDDIREAPALYIIDELLDAGVKIQAYDPEAMDNVKELYGDKITFSDNQYGALENADALAIVTEWSVFRTPDFNKLKSLLKDSIVFDGRNLYDLDKMRGLDVHYESIGRDIVKKSTPKVNASSNGHMHG